MNVAASEKPPHSKLGGFFRQMAQGIGSREEVGLLGDFTVTGRIVPITALAVVIGVACAYVALVLLRLIGLFTNLFYYQRWNLEFVSPAHHHLGYWALLVPIVGGLIVGLMARFGSDKIRGHGMPEAIEAILLRGSRVSPRVAVFKPISAAVAIGSGGPFGAEGPIIMTGGAVGSLIAQFFHLTDSERKTLLVAGAAAGMSAVFAAPVASVLLAVELLLFEWKPRSLIPVALASAVSAATRWHLLGLGPVFPTGQHDLFVSARVLAGCALVGLCAGVLAAALSAAIYKVEDTFEHVPLHWMWWPGLGGVAIGIGGLIFPPALGVGYDVIADLIAGNIVWHLVLGILLVKSTMWALSLGSGTSGGIVAPLLMMGAALGAGAAHFLPAHGPGFYPLVGMGAVLAGAIGAPLTGIVFSIELTHDINMLLPLLVGCALAHTFSTLFLRRSILTEKISRRGYHLSREYSVDPLEIVFAREAMRTNIVAFPASVSLAELGEALNTERQRGQYLYPVVGEDHALMGVLTRREVQELLTKYSNATAASVSLSEVVHPDPVLAYADEPLRALAQRMADTGITRFPVVERREDRRKHVRPKLGAGGHGKLVGMIGLVDLLKGRVQNLEAERHRERVLPIRVFFPLQFSGSRPPNNGSSKQS
ncbi:MAG: chloride channel protein [Terriglobales bacterium]